MRGVLVTHIHPDHYGLAGRIREASGAWIALHPADAALIHDRYEEPDDLLDRVGGFLRSVGAPEDEVATLAHCGDAGAWARRRRPSRRVDGGRRQARGGGMGPRGVVDAGPLAGSPVLLGRLPTA